MNHSEHLVDMYRAAVWGLDFMRALNERPHKWLIRILLGKYARQELNGMQRSLESAGCYVDTSYDLEHLCTDDKLLW